MCQSFVTLALIMSGYDRGGGAIVPWLLQSVAHMGGKRQGIAGSKCHMEFSYNPLSQGQGSA